MPTVRRIIVGVHGSLGSLQALRYAADEARQRNVPLLAVTAWVPPGGELAERRAPSAHLRKLWREAAWERLWAAFDAGLGGVPADLSVEPQVARGETGPVLVEAAGRPDDLLIIGTGRRAGIGRRYCESDRSGASQLGSQFVRELFGGAHYHAADQRVVRPDQRSYKRLPAICL